MAPLEIIGGGFGRTGTDSLRLALNKLGYNTHHMKVLFSDAEQNPEDFTHAFYHREQADWDRIYKNYNAAIDWPSVTFYQDLLKKYPNAKVILTVRDADSWYKSVKNTIFESSKRMSAAPPSHVEAQDFSKLKEMFATCFDGIFMDEERFSDEEKIKQMFRDHNEEVKRTVPPDQLLVMELGEGWERLCAFLGKEVPQEPYPNTNSTAEFREHFKHAPPNAP
ncbi:P-loop containing nucleoside triphosphate hydrolase protein [Blakeslea trispora]|nr:P-loop containing nucleoside triphosphate hydrolase protein [Blakeslea trispora]